MRVVADLQLHSKYSRAVSPDMNLETMAIWGKKKGIDLLATGDWTHPLWFDELQKKLVEKSEGIYECNGMQFLLATEISSIFKQDGRVRRVHTLIWVPSLDIALKINKELAKRGCNLAADGRPIVGLSCIQIAELVFGICENALIIPAHAWTPWFSVFGAFGGFDTLSQAYGPYVDKILAIETGISSDPQMNWQIPELDNRAIVSFSDAHSAVKMGREATIFEMENLSYSELYKAIKNKSIAYTVEFFPEEGKYHYNGHRACKVIQTPEQTRNLGTKCPVCGRMLTVGVMQRIEDLTKQHVEMVMYEDEVGMQWHQDKNKSKPPFVRLVSLLEILAEVHQVGVGSKKVKAIYEMLIEKFGNELEILMRTTSDEIKNFAGERLAEAILKVRRGDIFIKPGFDGEYGVVKIWPEKEEVQTRLF